MVCILNIEKFLLKKFGMEPGRGRNTGRSIKLYVNNLDEVR
jgi:hypothetical protein